MVAGSLGISLASIWMQKEQDDKNWDRQMDLAKLNRQWAREDYEWQMGKQIEYNTAMEQLYEKSESASSPSKGPAANPGLNFS